MKPLKTKDLRPCDNCAGPIAPIFYRVNVRMKQLMIDPTAVNQVMGTAQIFGGSLELGSAMSPNNDATIELPGYNIKKDILLCQDCAISHQYAIRPIDLMIESEGAGDE